MPKFLFLPLFFCSFLANNVTAQKMLRIDKTGSVKTRKLYIGDRLEFKMKGENEKWENQIIKDIDVEQGIITFNQFFIYLEDIESIRSKRARLRSLAYTLLTFGTTWAVYSVVTIPVGNELKTNSWAVPATSIGSGFLLLKLWGYKKFKRGRKYNYRLLDLSFR